MQGTYHYRKLVHPTELHVYHIQMSDDHAMGGWYCQLTSMDSFVRRIGARWQQVHRAHGLCIIQQGDGQDYPSGQAPYQIVEHYFESLWDFYKWIGFDHKNKTLCQLDKLITQWRAF